MVLLDRRTQPLHSKPSALLFAPWYSNHNTPKPLTMLEGVPQRLLILCIDLDPVKVLWVMQQGHISRQHCTHIFTTQHSAAQHTRQQST